MRDLRAGAAAVGAVSGGPIAVHAADRAATVAIASVVAGLIRPRDTVLLVGGLGAGKTAFVQDLCGALGATEPVTSPTFNLVHHYAAGALEVCHVDLYRLERTGELDDLGLDDLHDAGAVLVVEWGDLAGGALGGALSVAIGDLGGSARRFEFTDDGGQWASRWTALGRGLAGVA